MCIPLTSKLLLTREGEQWFDLTAFAGLVGQAYVVDREAGVWSFGAIACNASSSETVRPEPHSRFMIGKVMSPGWQTLKVKKR